MATRKSEENLGDVEAILARQERAMELMERLRADEPYPLRKVRTGGGRRDFRRWPTPSDVTLELHNGARWQPVETHDMGIGGAGVPHIPAWVEDGPVPARLKAPDVGSVLAMADVVWRDAKSEITGLRFEFQDETERELWAGALIEALLTAQAIQ